MITAPELRADERIAYGVTEAASAVGLRPHHLRKGIREGLIPTFAVARRTVILRDDLIEFIRRHDPPKSSRAQNNVGVLYD